MQICRNKAGLSMLPKWLVQGDVNQTIKNAGKFLVILAPTGHAMTLVSMTAYPSAYSVVNSLPSCEGRGLHSQHQQVDDCTADPVDR